MAIAFGTNASSCGCTRNSSEGHGTGIRWSENAICWFLLSTILCCFVIVQLRKVIFAFVSTHLQRTQVLVSPAKLPGIMSKWCTGEKGWWPFWRFKQSHLQSFLRFLVCKIGAADDMATGSFPLNMSVFLFLEALGENERFNSAPYFCPTLPEVREDSTFG